MTISDVKNGNDGAANPKLTVMGLADLDMRTNAAKRARQLINELVEEYGGTPDLPLPIEQRIRIVDLAVLHSITEDMAASYFCGKPIDRLAYAALINVKRRLLNSL
jgi:hypothetical protein